MNQSRATCSMPSAALRACSLVALLCGCDTNERGGAMANADPTISAPVLEIRLRDDAAERGSLLGDSRVLVQTEHDRLFLYRRADGQRTSLEGGTTNGKPPNVVWAQALPEGTIAAYDFRARQVIVFDTAGAVVGTTSLRSPTGTPAPLAAFRGGNMILLRDFMPSPYVQETGEFADTTVLMPVSADIRATGSDIPVTMARRFGALDDQRASDEAPRQRASVRVVGAGVFDGRARHSIAAPLSPRAMFGAASDGLYVGTSDSAEVRFLDPTGHELNRFQIAETTLVVGPATVARLRKAPKNDLGISFTDLYQQVRIPDRTPRYRQLRADHAGRLWVEPFSLDQDEPPRWVVYTRGGTRVGSVTLPAGSRLLDASERELLLARKGRMGAELLQVVAYHLR